MNYYMQHGFYPYSLYSPSPYSPFFNLPIIPERDLYSQNIGFNITQPNNIYHQNTTIPSETNSVGPRLMTNVVLMTQQENHKQGRQTEGDSKADSAKAKKKLPCIQKENRNVTSNLLRIFFKNVLEVTSYDECVNYIIQKQKIETTAEEFYIWLESFKINYKNYIKPTSIRNILSAKNCQAFQKMFRILLKHYMNNMGLTHCLTSKRIDHSCTRRHVEGLKKLLTL